MAAFHTIRGVEEGMQLDVLTGGTLPFLLVCCARSPFPFRRSARQPPISIPHAKLSLVPSQIIKLVAASRRPNLNHPARRSFHLSPTPRKERTRRRPDEISKEAFDQVRANLFSHSALTKRADDSRVPPLFPTIKDKEPFHPRHLDIHTSD